MQTFERHLVEGALKNINFNDDRITDKTDEHNIRTTILSFKNTSFNNLIAKPLI